MLAVMPFSFSSGCLADVVGPYPFSKTLKLYWLRKYLLLGDAHYILVVKYFLISTDWSFRLSVET